MTQQTVWMCEQWLGGKVKEQNVFMSEEQAREFARKLAGMSPGPGVQDRADADTACMELMQALATSGEFGLVPHRYSIS